MKVTVVGVQKIDYFNKNRNAQVTGVNLHCTYPDSRVDGLMCEAIYVSNRNAAYSKALSVPVGSAVNISYNSSGYFDDIEIISKK